MDTKVRVSIKKLIPRAAAQWKRPRLWQNIFLSVVLLYKKKGGCNSRWRQRENVVETEHGKILPVIYCTCILIAPIPLFSFSAQNCSLADPGNGLLPADPCQFWSLIQTYMLAREQKAASTSCHEYFPE